VISFRDRILAERKPRRKSEFKRPKRESRPAVGRAAHEIRLRRVADGGWEFVHPRCARDRADDIEEVQAMIAAGEIEIARDEIRWLLQGCPDFLEAHKLLGELAYAEHDLPLARGHFGYAFRVGQQAIARADNPRPIPYLLPANRAFHESGKALALCLVQLDKRDLASEVVKDLLSYDPSDPLGVRQAFSG
jgi:tetratricopeptide (TPR) repeat protein